MGWGRKAPRWAANRAGEAGRWLRKACKCAVVVTDAALTAMALAEMPMSGCTCFSTCRCQYRGAAREENDPAQEQLGSRRACLEATGKVFFTGDNQWRDRLEASMSSFPVLYLVTEAPSSSGAWLCQ